MSYYLFNRPEILQKAKGKHYNCDGEEKAAEYKIKDKDVLKENTNYKYGNFFQEEKEAKRKY